VKDELRIRYVNPLHEDIQACAMTCSLSREREISGVELRAFARDLMSSLSAACVERGAKVIGHIKGYIEYETGFLHAHTVGEPENITVDGRDGDPASHLTVVINAVVYGMTAEAIRAAAEFGFESSRRRFGFLREPE
jgi:hypothetical protein